MAEPTQSLLSTYTSWATSQRAVWTLQTPPSSLTKLVVMAPGFVYACCRQGQLDSVKVGFTTQDPHVYTSGFSRTLCPLQVLAIRPFSNARLAEAMVFHIMCNRRVNPKHEVFDLSGQDGPELLQTALDHASTVDALPGLPVPSIPDKEAASAERKRQERNVLLDPANRPENPEDQEFKAAAKHFQRCSRIHEEQQAKQQLTDARRKRKREEEEAAQGRQSAEVVDWLAANVQRVGDQKEFVRRSQLWHGYKASKPQNVPGKSTVGKQEFLQILLSQLGAECYREQYKRDNINHRGVFLEWQHCGNQVVN